MADEKLSAQDPALTLVDTDIIYVVTAGSPESFKMTVGDFRKVISRVPPVVIATATHTLTADNIGKTLIFTFAGAITVTMPEDSTEALDAGFQCVMFASDALGVITAVKEGTDTLQSLGDLVSSAGKGGPISPYKNASGSWWLFGALA